MRKMFEKSQETSSILDVFLGMKMTQQMTFGQLSKIVGFSVSSTLSAYQSAVRIAEKDHGIYIAPIRGVGFCRGTGEDMADSLASLARRMRRTAKKSIGRADLAIQNNLTAERYHRTCELRNRASIVYSTSSAPMPASNRKRQEPAKEAGKVTPFAALQGAR